MHQTKKGNQWHFGVKAHIGADAESGLVHTVVGTAANVHDVTQTHALLHGEETCGFGDVGYRGAEKREGMQIEKIKAGVRAKVEHPFRVIRRQFGYVKTRYRGLAKNTAQLITLFALSNLWMVRRSLLQGGASGGLAGALFKSQNQNKITQSKLTFNRLTHKNNDTPGVITTF